jgi:hypothetical protein
MTHNTAQLGRTASPTRMTTRSKNADAHPGAILQDTQRARRTKEEINQEKQLKILRLEAKEKARVANAAKKARGEAYIAQLEEAEDVTLANADNDFPRHKPKKSLS